MNSHLPPTWTETPRDTSESTFPRVNYRAWGRVNDSWSTHAQYELVEHLVEQWEMGTRHLSSPSACAKHPAFKRLVELDKDAIPSLLRVYRKEAALFT